MTNEEILQRIAKHFPGPAGRELYTVLTAFNAQTTALDAWGDALAAKLNADGGVTDTDYVGPSL